LTYKLLSDANAKFSPITFDSNKTAIFPAKTSFKLSDDGYNYIVSNYEIYFIIKII